MTNSDEDMGINPLVLRFRSEGYKTMEVSHLTIVYKTSMKERQTKLLISQVIIFIQRWSHLITSDVRNKSFFGNSFSGSQMNRIKQKKAAVRD